MTDSQKLDRILEILEGRGEVKDPSQISRPGVGMSIQEAFLATKDVANLSFEVDTDQLLIVFKKKSPFGVHQFSRPLAL